MAPGGRSRLSAQGTESPRSSRQTQGKGTGRRASAGGKENMEVDDVAEAVTVGATPAPQSLSNAQVADMYKNCIKLAAENKISQKNTWSLRLIDHMSDLVKPAEEGRTTNFQHASCTLDAGIKIYAYRVDSVHSEAFKVLGGLSRTAGAAEEDEPDGGEGEGDVEQSQGGGRRRRAAADADPNSTLESSFEALNVKKFDLAFAVDPLFHKTSAQFDEGGASGLLLNNLSVYRGCEIVFDSSDVPERALDAAGSGSADVQLDLSALQKELQTLREAPADVSIAPTLDAISELLGQSAEPDAAAAAAQLVAEVAGGREAAGAAELASGLQNLRMGSGGSAAEQQDGSADVQPAEMPDDYPDDGYDGGDSDGGSPAPGDGSGWLGPDAGEGLYDGSSRSPSGGPAADGGSALSGGASGRDGSRGGGGLSEQAVRWLMDAGAGAGPVTRGAGWAGASHWRYRAEPDPAAADKPKAAARRRKATAIDFENLPPLPEDAFKLAVRKEQICVKTLTAKDTLLPEDLHYEAKQLAELFLKPGRPVTRSMTRGQRGADGAAADGYASSNDGGGCDYGGGSDDEGEARDSWGGSPDDEGEGGLVSVPRKVGNTSIAYASTSKQVDVRRLKEALWRGIQQLRSRQQAAGDGPDAPPAEESAPLRFQDLIAGLGDDSGAGRLADLSVHLCFICLLHLANEHGLVIADAADLRQLTISNIPAR